MKARPTDTIPDRLIGIVRRRLEEGLQVRRTLPGWGRLAIDRPLPFLCVYRRPGRRTDSNTFRLVTSEASYLTCSSAASQQEGISRLVAAVVEIEAEKFDRYLILEIWAGRRPATRLCGSGGTRPLPTKYWKYVSTA